MGEGSRRAEAWMQAAILFAGLGPIAVASLMRLVETTLGLVPGIPSGTGFAFRAATWFFLALGLAAAGISAVPYVLVRRGRPHLGAMAGGIVGLGLLVLGWKVWVTGAWLAACLMIGGSLRARREA